MGSVIELTDKQAMMIGMAYEAVKQAESNTILIARTIAAGSDVEVPDAPKFLFDGEKKTLTIEAEPTQQSGEE